ncbi:MAG: FHA domain-containing protein [Solirubrobacterales bacterium]
MTSGPAAGTTVEIERELVLGREGSDIEIPDSEASRRHAVVRPVEGGIEVEDLGSMNGTHVNGRRIDAPVLVDSSSTMRIGTSLMAFDLAPPSVSEQAPLSPDVTVARDVVAEPDVTVARDVAAGPDVTAPRAVPSPDVTAPRKAVPSPDVTAPRNVVKGPDVTAPRQVVSPPPDVTVQRDVPQASAAPTPERGKPPAVLLAAAGIAVAVIVLIILLLL